MSFFNNPAMLAPARVIKTELPSGGFVLRSPQTLNPGVARVGDWLERWAKERSDQLAFAEAAAQGGWIKLSWSQLRQKVGALAQSFLDLGLPAEQPIAVLSDNSLDHLIVMLAGMHIGVPVCTVSSGYSRLAGGDFSKIHGILQTLAPSLIYAHDAKTYGPALRDCGVAATLVFTEGADSFVQGGSANALSLTSLLATPETSAVAAAFAKVGAQSHAKYLLTSGSTGAPKVVINTHHMLSCNQEMIAQVLPFLNTQPLVLLDWLPWSHTFGGNHNLNMVLRAGGTLYIDDGRPMPGLVDKTIQHLREVKPSIYFNVPRGYDMLLPALEADLDLAKRFLSELSMLFYAGAGMPAATWERLEKLAVKVRQEPLWMTTSWGATETSPGITFSHWKLDRAGVIGLPMPGVDLKFVPNAGKLEMRVRGPNIFSGYRGNAKATQEAFDDEGYYLIGDAGYLLDEQDPNKGVVFNGRVAEDFKLTSGTWVSVGTLRLRLVTALAPYVQDAVITGHDQASVGALLFITEAGRKLSPDALLAHVRQGMLQLKTEGGGSSQMPTRALVLNDLPSLATGEITDKGYLNQRLCLQRRADQVAVLYGPSDSRVIAV